MAVKVSVISSPKNRVSINKQDRTIIRTVGIAAPISGTDVISAFNKANTANDIAVAAFAYANSIAANAVTQLVNLTDVDASDVDNNETLVYDDVSGKFVVKELPIINGGTF